MLEAATYKSQKWNKKKNISFENRKFSSSQVFFIIIITIFIISNIFMPYFRKIISKSTF